MSDGAINNRFSRFLSGFVDNIRDYVDNNLFTQSKAYRSGVHFAEKQICATENFVRDLTYDLSDVKSNNATNRCLQGFASGAGGVSCNNKRTAQSVHFKIGESLGGYAKLVAYDLARLMYL